MVLAVAVYKMLIVAGIFTYCRGAHLTEAVTKKEECECPVEGLGDLAPIRVSISNSIPDWEPVDVCRNFHRLMLKGL